ncbi:MAG: CHRD domain-containing protein [Novosphingobium sp.]|nr:CHRD domain-containing protein [Novosphingobium sp.]
MKRMSGTLVLSLAGLALAPNASAAPRLPEQVTLTAALDGKQEVPFAGDPDGSGTFSATLVRKTRELCYELAVQDIEPATLVQIQVGKSGDHDIGIVKLATPGPDGRASGCITLPADITKDLIMLPQYHYVNVYNAGFPAGAVRGQLSK